MAISVEQRRPNEEHAGIAFLVWGGRVRGGISSLFATLEETLQNLLVEQCKGCLSMICDDIDGRSLTTYVHSSFIMNKVAENVPLPCVRDEPRTSQMCFTHYHTIVDRWVSR